jgi:hypothetical protein
MGCGVVIRGSWAASPKRLKALPREPIPSVAIPYELAAIPSLRELTLVKAAVNLIAQSNRSATFPGMRALRRDSHATPARGSFRWIGRWRISLATPSPRTGQHQVKEPTEPSGTERNS